MRNRTLCALREHPETLQPVFAALDLPPDGVAEVCLLTNTQSWTVVDRPRNWIGWSLRSRR